MHAQFDITRSAQTLPVSGAPTTPDYCLLEFLQLSRAPTHQTSIHSSVVNNRLEETVITLLEDNSIIQIVIKTSAVLKEVSSRNKEHSNAIVGTANSWQNITMRVTLSCHVRATSNVVAYTISCFAGEQRGIFIRIDDLSSV
ncbi:hypothetical protein J6590_095264 [Homalodisca vitripennis]|nr:hypothetical protein J6590_095264 [Homalodisca vitripennis]